MSKVTIVTDSTAYLPEEQVKQFGIVVAPQILIWDNKTFLDGIDIQPDEFYTRLKTATVMPSTSQVTIPYFKQIFQELLDQDREILAMLVSNKLSGTIDSAIQARAMLPDSSITVVDSESTSMALGFQVLTVARAAKEGANLKECHQLAEESKKHTGVVFAVDTLEFLHRGGRIGGGSRYLGTALNIKPILELKEGKIEAVERVRTRKKSLLRILEIVEQRVQGKTPLRLAALHANAAGEAETLLQLASQKMHPVEQILAQVSPVVGTHAGPGTVGIAYMTEM